LTCNLEIADLNRGLKDRSSILLLYIFLQNQVYKAYLSSYFKKYANEKHIKADNNLSLVPCKRD